MEILLALAQKREILVPNNLQIVNIPETIEALRLTLYQRPKCGQEPNVRLLFIPRSPSEPLQQVEVNQTRLEKEVPPHVSWKLTTSVTLYSEDWLSESRSRCYTNILYGCQTDANTS